MKISVVIVTLNEERNLARCLESVAPVADEIVVVDSLSSDKTTDIAASFGATVILQPFLGYTKQKNFANQHASHDWVLSLDADEALSPGLVREIQFIKNNPKHNAYSLPRLTNYCGRWIKHCGWYPDRKTRLFDKTKGAWVGEVIHEQWQANDGATTGVLNCDLLHYSYYTISDHIKQIEKFTEISAIEAVRMGKRCSLAKLYFGPKWNFFKDYFLRLGILDGIEGYYICKFSAFASEVKYSKIRQYSRLAKKCKSTAFAFPLPNTIAAKLNMKQA